MTPRRRRHVRLKRTRFALGLGLTMSLAFAAGMTDAIGLILVGQYVSFMSGNTTQLGVSLVEGDGGTALFLGAILAAFVAGNALGEIVMRLAGRRHAVLLFVIAVLVASPLLGALPWSILPAVVGMGMLNAGVEQIDGHAFGITFVTGALSRFGRGIGRWIMGDRRGAWTYQIVPWAGMMLGALAGGLGYLVFGANALLLAALACAALGLASLAIPANWRRGYALPLKGR